MDPWLWNQRWHDLLFQHWPIDPARLRPLVPRRLEIETWEGSAWVAVTPFRISGMGFRGVPLPPFGTGELNVRTYVTDGRHRGVWFLSLDAASRFFVAAGRMLYRLPYVYAEIDLRREGSRVIYRSRRPGGAAFQGAWQATGAAVTPAADSFDHWCVERYCLYAGTDASLWRARIAHPPWELAPADVQVERNDMLAVHGLSASGPAAPSRCALPQKVTVWLPEKLPL